MPPSPASPSPVTDLSAPIPYEVLVVEDTDTDAEIVDRTFRKEQLGARDKRLVSTRCHTLAEALERLESNTYDAILLDLGLPDAFGMEGVACFMELGMSTPIIVLTGGDEMEIGIESLRIGASDHLAKNEIGPHSLPRAVRYAIERSTRTELLRSSGHQPTDSAVRDAVQSMLTPDPDRPTTLRTSMLEIATGFSQRGQPDGDFCELLETSGGTIIGLIGDARSTRSPASLLALQLIAAFRTLVASKASISEVATAMNRYVAMYAHSDDACRIFLFEIDMSQQQIRYLNWGTHAWLLESNVPESQPTSDIIALQHQDEPFGSSVSEELSPLLQTQQCSAEGMLLVTTNDCCNIGNDADERFEKERLTSSLKHAFNESASVLADAALKALHSFSNQKVDQAATLVAIKFRALGTK